MLGGSTGRAPDNTGVGKPARLWAGVQAMLVALCPGNWDAVSKVLGRWP